MKRSDLRHRITIEKYTQFQDENSGAVSQTWVEYLSNIPADVQYLSAKEQIQAQQLQSKIEARIVIRYRNEQLDTSMRIIYNSQVFDIQGIIPDNETGKKHLTITVATGLKI